MKFETLIRLAFSLLMVASLVCGPNTHAGEVYASAVFNKSYVDELVDVENTDILLDGNTSGVRLALGYEVNDYFAAEVAYTNFGELEQSVLELNLSADAKAQELAILGRLPLGERFALFGRIAYVSWDGDIGVDSQVEGISGNDPSFGAGLEFEVGESLSLGLSGARYRLDDLDLTVLGLGIRFRF